MKYIYLSVFLNSINKNGDSLSNLVFSFLDKTGKYSKIIDGNYPLSILMSGDKPLKGRVDIDLLIKKLTEVRNEIQDYEKKNINIQTSNQPINKPETIDINELPF